ncbi:YbbR-like domain-containing protein [Pontibacillus salicampi]|uniref:YbbR-like domain-containing protein n=1 Tax=Pontibacillus salicampi TaxID=1449801 RepID=A0ABV6LN31_9BACI
MDRWLKNPWFIRVLALILALLLYASVNLDETTTETGSILPEGNKELTSMNNIPLQVYMNDEKYVIEGVPQNVTVTVEGPNSEVTKTVRQKNFDVYVDLENLEPGTHTVPIEHRGISNQLSVYMQPEEVEVTIEEKSQASFNVDIDFVNRGSMEEGFEVGDPKVEPANVQVTGSKTEVAKVSLVKAIVNLSGASEDISIKDAPVKVYDQQGNELNVFVEPNTVQVDAPIVPPSTEVSLDIQTKGDLPEGLSIESITANPEKVNVFGPSDTLGDISVIDGITVDLSTISEDTTLDVDVPVPENATKVEPGSVKVKVDVEETAEKTVNDVNLEVRNLSENQNITFLDPESKSVNLTIQGTKQELEAIEKDQFEAYVNAEDAEAEEAELPIEVKGPDNVKWNMSTEKARVRIE